MKSIASKSLGAVYARTHTDSLKNKKGITLISLVVTIIILLILSGVAISQITGENGLFTRAKQAKLETKRSQVIEFLSLKLIEEQGTEETLTENEILEKTKQNIIDNKQELEKIVKKLEEVGEIETEEDGEKVNPYFYVTADKDVYKVEIAGVKFIGELGKFAPTIKIISLKSESNSITVEVKTGRKGNGKIEYYIKEEGEAKYQLKETQSEERYVYNGLKQGKKYNIKVVVIAENKQKAEVEGEKTTGEVTNLEEGDIKFEYTVEGKEIEATKWTNKEVTVKAIPNIDIGNYKLQTSTDGENFEEKDNQTFNANGTMYVILTDGTNYGSSATATVTKIDKVLPSASILLSSTSTTTIDSITATVNLVDNESGINIEKCKWIYNTTATAIGTNESSYTGGTFTSTSQELTLKSTSSGTYYLHVLATDNAENQKEIISQAITVQNKTYTVTYNANGGTGSMQTDTVAYGAAYTTRANAFTRNGYTFAGWNEASNGTGTDWTSWIGKPWTWTYTKSITLYAKWTANRYTVTYNANGGTGSMATDTVAYGTAYTTKSNAFTRNGYTFAGWNEASNGTGTDWTSWIGKPWTWTYTKNITLYAKWTANRYTITYNANGGTGSMPTQTGNGGSTVTLAQNKFTAPAKKIFKGWSTGKTLNDTRYKAGSNYTLNGNVTLYAIWGLGEYYVGTTPYFAYLSANKVVSIDLSVYSYTTKIENGKKYYYISHYSDEDWYSRKSM